MKIKIDRKITRKEFAAKLGKAEQSAKGGLEKLEIVLFASAFWRGGRKGGLVFALPPAEPVNEIGSDIFKYPPANLKPFQVSLKGF